MTATWLSPVLKGPQVDYGYDISDFTQVDEIFGTNEDLEELFAEAHDRGIKIIMDFVRMENLLSFQCFDSFNFCRFPDIPGSKKFHFK